MIHYTDATVTLHHGDSLQVLTEIPDASIDAVVTDPPYGLEFMGREWDAADGFRRSLNPADAGRDNAFGRASRTSPEYRTGKPANAKIRTRVDGRTNGAAKATVSVPESYQAGPIFQQWCQAWASECLRVLKPGGHLLAFGGTRTFHRLACAVEDAGFEIRDSIAWLYGSGFPKSLNVGNAIRGGIEEPVTPESEQWQGWGTALKPAFEPIVVGRRPIVGTVAANVLAHGTGALNIDSCRIQAGQDYRDKCASVVGLDSNRNGAAYGEWTGIRQDSTSPGGRWPANVVLDESQATDLDEQTGEQRDGVAVNRNTDPETRKPSSVYGAHLNGSREDQGFGGGGGASRFFYTAKASSDERITHNGTAHPTVKPLSLMRWLVRLVTPPGGTILEPFAGSGTTVEAAILEGFRCIAIEREAAYLPLITQRIHRRRDPVAYITAAGEDLGLFGDPA